MSLDEEQTSRWLERLRDMSDDDIAEIIRRRGLQPIRGPLAAKKHLLEMQVHTHEGKADAARRKLEALRMVPDRDPYGDGAVLKVQMDNRARNGSLTYVLLRAHGLWYTTGRDGRAPYKAGWAAVADWLVTNGVTQVTEMVGASLVWLDGAPVESVDTESLPADPTRRDAGGPPPKTCGNAEVHAAHVWVEGDVVEDHLGWTCLGVGAGPRIVQQWEYVDGPAVGDSRCPKMTVHMEHGWHQRGGTGWSPVYHCPGWGGLEPYDNRA